MAALGKEAALEVERGSDGEASHDESGVLTKTTSSGVQPTGHANKTSHEEEDLEAAAGRRCGCAGTMGTERDVVGYSTHAKRAKGRQRPLTDRQSTRQLETRLASRTRDANRNWTRKGRGDEKYAPAFFSSIESDFQSFF